VQSLNLEREIDGFVSQLDVLLFQPTEQLALAHRLRTRLVPGPTGIQERRACQL
jgi:hypothetical protein